MRAQSKSIFFVMGLVTLLSAWRHAGSMSPDLLASWMAGLNFARGAMDDIYFASTGAFTMRPPQSWITELQASGYDGAIYPFIYPPLWAWVMSKITAITSFETFVFLGNLINPLLIMTSILLAARMAARHVSRLQFLLIGVFALGSSVIAIVALEQNQPQILVSFLLVLAAERTLHGDSRTAGIALALAASIKLYPAVFAVIWLAQRNRTALISFTLFGGALGLASIAFAGWPLHAAFLIELSAISGTALVTFFTYSIDATVAQMFFKDQAQLLLGAGDTGVAWHILKKPAVWRALDSAAMLGVIGGIFWFARRPCGMHPLFWPACFVALALVSPLSWGFHYLSAVVFLPVLMDRLGIRWGALAMFVILWPTSLPYIVLASEKAPWAMTFAQPGGTAAMVAFGALLVLLIRRSDLAAPTNDPSPQERKAALPAQ